VNLDHGNIRGIVPRSKRVKVEALDRFGTHLYIDASGLVARVLQHEIDHLNGRLFIDRIDNPKKAHYVTNKDRQLYLRSKKDHWKKYKDVSKLVKAGAGKAA
jgi:peptide deformylase